MTGTGKRAGHISHPAQDMGKTELSAFDAAELDANIISTNAIKVSSFVSPHWKIINSKQKLKRFTDNGAFLPMACAFAVSNTSKVAASISIVGSTKIRQKLQ